MTGTTRVPTNADYLAQTVALLWPGATLVPDRVAPGASAFIAFPSARDPRWLIPRARPSGFAAVLGRENHETSLAQRWMRSAGSAALRRGVPARVGSAVRVDGAGEESVESYLTDLLGQEVRVLVGIGVPRANQKPVLQVLDRSGSTVGFVKVGIDPATRALVRREAENLAHPALRTLPGLVAPEVTALTSWRGLELLVLEPLNAVGRYRPKGDVPIDQMRGLSRVDRHSGTIADSAWLKRAGQTSADLADSAPHRRFAALLDQVRGESGSVNVEWGAWHGDWGPWNMAWRDDRVVLWDWERFDTDVPVGFDVVHYAIRAHTRRHGSTPEVAGRALTSVPPLLRRMGPDSNSPDLTIGLYLLEIARRYLLASQDERGRSLRPTAEWTLDMATAYWSTNRQLR